MHNSRRVKYLWCLAMARSWALSPTFLSAHISMEWSQNILCVSICVCLTSCYSHCHLVVLLLFLHYSFSADLTICFVLTLQWMRVESNRLLTPVQTQGSLKTASASAMTLGNHPWILCVLSPAWNKPSLSQTYWPLHLVPLSHTDAVVCKGQRHSV